MGQQNREYTYTHPKEISLYKKASLIVFLYHNIIISIVTVY